jgi:hypothetical protein
MAACAMAQQATATQKTASATVEFMIGNDTTKDGRGRRKRKAEREAALARHSMRPSPFLVHLPLSLFLNTPRR